MRSSVKRELTVFLILIAVGLLGLPPAVFWVGQHVVGEYGDKGSIWDLTRAVWLALVEGQVAAWVLVLSPYLVVALLRLASVIWHARKAGEPVNEVTVSRNK